MMLIPAAIGGVVLAIIGLIAASKERAAHRQPHRRASDPKPLRRTSDSRDQNHAIAR